MRGWLVFSVLALASCSEQNGWNPNYMFGSNAYGEYKREREVSLTTGAPASQVVPIALPAKSPTPEQIAGQSPVPVPVVPGVAVTTTAAAATQGNAPTNIVPQSMNAGAQGPYPGSVPVLVQYASAAEHPVGQGVYSRAGASTATEVQACASYANADAAQIGFLAAGGPRKDPRGMDPDGDGYVCGWDPEKFRQSQL